MTHRGLNPIKGTITKDIDYYYNGNFKTDRVAKKDTGLNPYSLYEINGQMIIQKHGWGVAYKSNKYYPNGKLMNAYEHTLNTEGKSEHRTTFYNPDGTVDSNTFIRDARDFGTYREYYNNGNPRSIENLYYGKRHGCQLDWLENGEVRAHGFVDKDDWVPCVETYYNGRLFKQSIERNGLIIQFDPVNKREFEQLFLPFISQMYFNQKKGTVPSIEHSGSYVRDEGKRLNYYVSGRLAYEMNFQSDLAHGPFTIYDTSGIKVAEGSFNKGLLNGSYKTYTITTGQLLNEDNYSNNKKEGISVHYFPNTGRIHYKVKWKQGVSDGETEAWTIYGNLIHIVTEDKERQISTNTSYHDNGNVSSRHIKKWGRRDYDTLYTYRNDGTPETRQIHRDGAEDKYLKTKYYANGNKCSEVEITSTTELHTYTNWYANGHIKSTGELTPNKDGVWLYYDSVGYGREKRIFKMGNEIIPIPPTSVDPCFCNEFIDRSKYYDFGQTTSINYLMENIPLSKRFQLPAIEAQNDICYQQPHKIIAYGDLKIMIDGNKDFVLNLTPCRHGENFTTFGIRLSSNIGLPFRYSEIVEAEPFYYFYATHTPLEWFVILLKYKREVQKYDPCPFLLDVAVNITGDTASKRNFLRDSYHYNIDAKPEHNNDEENISLAGEILKAMKASSTKEEDFTNGYVKKYFDYFIKPKLKNTSPDKIFDLLFFSYPTESDDDLFYEDKSPDDVVYSFHSFRERYLMKLSISATVKHAAIEFPLNILRNKTDSTGKNKLSENVHIAFQSNNAVYSGFPEERITIIRGGTTCMKEVEIAGTGILIKASNALVDLNTKMGPDSVAGFNTLPFPAHQTYSIEAIKNAFKTTNISKQTYYIKHDTYLENFMGVVLQDVELRIPLPGGAYLNATSSNMLVDGTEINGTISIDKTEVEKAGSNAFVVNILSKAGLKIVELPDIVKKSIDKKIHIYFTFKGKKKQ